MRGGMDASQYKDYVLVLLFVRYVSDKYADQKNALVIIPKGGSFADLVALKGKPNIGEGINMVLSTIAEANGLRGVIDTVDFNDEDKLGKGKEMQDRLTNLVAIFENPELDFSKNRAEGDDLLGDAYEYLMKNFAVESGKSKGQFYTPAEVSRIIANVIGAHNSTGKTQTVYDPACGSGSLLLKVAGEATKGISIYGQELDNATAALASMNMWLHSKPDAEIKKGQSTLSNPQFFNKGELRTFNYVVANPPFSTKAWRNGFHPEEDLYDRFTGFGIPPAKNGDYAFLLHILKSMNSTGKGAVVLPHGVLFRGNGESHIRTNIIKRGYINGIISLPANLFYGTGIPACIIVLDKEGATTRKGIFMIDASKGFVKDGNKNRLQERDIKKIIDVFDSQLEVTKYSRFISNEEIQRNEYNLNIPRYIDGSEPEDLQDIEAHLNGGIPNADIEAFEQYWQVCPTLKKAIFKPLRSGYSELATDTINKTILSHKEFVAFRTEVLSIFTKWLNKTTGTLKKIGIKDHPKAVIGAIADDILVACTDLDLIDKYDIYQHLMSYWAEVMQDDTYIITVDGWNAGNQVVHLQKESKGKKKDIQGLVGLEGRLIPVQLLISIYFKTEQDHINTLSAKLEQIDVDMDELKDEHGGEEGALSEVIDDKEKVSKASVQRRIRDIGDDKEFTDELVVLKKYLALFNKESEIKDAIKTSERDLEQKVLARYTKLTIEEIKTIVVQHKWMEALAKSVVGEIDKISQHLAGRVRELAERYTVTMPEIMNGIKESTKKVEVHLKKMGFLW
jgi:type I restriction enzyme M protein